MGENCNVPLESRAQYLRELLNDREVVSNASLPLVHVDRLLDKEINRVRETFYKLKSPFVEEEGEEMPEAVGPIIRLQEKVMVPVKKYPSYNFVGRVLGPRGLTIRQLEKDTGCIISVRGRGSMRDKDKEERLRRLQRHDHLTEDLHVLVTVMDTEERAKLKMARALKALKKVLVPAYEWDELKRTQLMELAIIKGTLRMEPKLLPPEIYKDKSEILEIPVPNERLQLPPTPLPQFTYPPPPPLALPSMAYQYKPFLPTDFSSYVALMLQQRALEERMKTVTPS